MWFNLDFIIIICIIICKVSLLHASMRLRSLNNKISNRIEAVGLKQTPMGLLLLRTNEKDKEVNGQKKKL